MIVNNINYGPQNHEKLGADFLRNLNVPESICCIVEGHVQAKRYLVSKVTFMLHLKKFKYIIYE